MKFIIAIIRITKMNETKLALSDAGLPSFTALGVLGRGQGRGIGPTYQKMLSDEAQKEAIKNLGAEPRLKSKRMIQLVVPDDKKELAISTIIKINKTGNSGDGKIYVTEALDAIKIRTFERGDLVLD